MQSKELVIVMGEPYSGREDWARRKAGPGVRVSLGGRSLHWGVKKLKAALTGDAAPGAGAAAGSTFSSRVVIDDDVTLGEGARKSLIEAASTVAKGHSIALQVKGVLVDAYGGDQRKVWEREWQRSEEGASWHPREQIDIEPIPPAIGEGFDVLWRRQVKLVPRSALNTSSLVLDASVMLAGDQLRPDVTPLLHAWYAIPSSVKVAIVIMREESVMKRAGCTGPDMPTIAATLERCLAALQAPFPIYVYAPLRVLDSVEATNTTSTGTSKPSARPCSGLGQVLAEAKDLTVDSLRQADFAYLQHKHNLNLKHCYVSSSTSLLGSAAEKLRRLAAVVGLRYVDANALFAAAASHADIGSVLKKISEKPGGRLLEFVGSVNRAARHPYPYLTPEDSAGSRDAYVQHEVASRTSTTKTYHGLVMQKKDAAAFGDSLPALVGSDKPAAGGAPREAAAPLAIAEDKVVAFFGDAQVARGAKFFKKGMVELVSCDAPRFENDGGGTVDARYTCVAADGNKAYSVFLTLNVRNDDGKVKSEPDAEGEEAPKAADGRSPQKGSDAADAAFAPVFDSIAAALCECGKDMVDNIAKCRHAAGAAMHLSVVGVVLNYRSNALQQDDEDTDEPTHPDPQQQTHQEPDHQPEPIVNNPAAAPVGAIAFGSQQQGPNAVAASILKDLAYLAALPSHDTESTQARTSSATSAHPAATATATATAAVLKPEEEPATPPPTAATDDASTPPARHLPAFMQRPTSAARPAAAAATTRPRAATAAGRGRVTRKVYPNAPKVPLTAYFHFLAAVRRETTQANPGVSVAALSKIMGALWRECSEDDKKKYAALAKQDKERYAQELEEYKKTDEYKTVAAAQSEAKASDARRAPGRKSPPKAGSPRKGKPPSSSSAAAAADQAGGQVAGGLSRQGSDASFYARFQRNTSWRLADDGRWVHEWDTDSGGDLHSDDNGAKDAKKRPIREPLAPNRRKAAAHLAKPEIIDDGSDDADANPANPAAAFRPAKRHAEAGRETRTVRRRLAPVHW
ncbi:Non-histone chromosomal protein 6 [Diplonema papillatum]|nr:Non-histone chromosomal protein 6 [Diplonema papillatum]